MATAVVTFGGKVKWLKVSYTVGVFFARYEGKFFSTIFFSLSNSNFTWRGIFIVVI